MRRLTRCGVIAGALMMSGCQGNPYATTPPGWNQMSSPAGQAGADWNARLDQLDSSNRQLHTQLAQSEQQAKILRDQLEAVQKRLADTAQQLRTSQESLRSAEQKYAALQATGVRRGSAMITANSSLRKTLQMVDFNLPGVQPQYDGEVIRISIPMAQLFPAGGNQLQTSAYPSLDKVAMLLSQHYPRQRVSVETQASSTATTTGSAHYLSTAQSLAVVDYFTSRSRLPAGQFYLMVDGSHQDPNRPAAIDIVIHPETF